jgi:hypothetical protein
MASYPRHVGKPRLAELWSGGRVTAGVAMGVAAVGFLLIRGVARIHIFGGTHEFFLYASCYLIATAVLALAATEVMRLLLLRNTPRPRVFFVWISAVATAIAFLLPLITAQPLAQRMGFAFINLITAAAISVLESVSATAVSDEPERPRHLDPPRSIEQR